jgi:hypothetical protein
MADSITVENLPAAGFPAYAGYTSGFWPTFPVLQERFPHAHLLSVAVNAAHDAQCLDVEPGDATNGQAPAWVRRQHARGIHRPCVYTSASNAGALVRTLAAAGIARARYRLWSAHYGLGPHICSPRTCAYPGVPPCDGTQFTKTGRGAHGSLIDHSVLRDDFFTGGDMAVSKTDIAAIAKAVAFEVWNTDGIVAAPQASPGNPFWEPHRILTDTGEQVRKLADAVGAIPTAAEFAAAVVAALPPPETGGLTEADVEKAVAATFARAFSPSGA